MSIDKYFNRRYHVANYNCAHLVCEVWAELRGPEMAELLGGFLCRPTNRVARLSDLKRFKVLEKPEPLCVVFMQAPKAMTHVGVWIRGKVLHILSDKGVQYQPLEVASIGFSKIRFITC